MKPSVNLLPKYERYSNLSYFIFIIGLIIFLILASTLTYLFINERKILSNHESQINILTEQKQALETRLSSKPETDTTTLSDAVVFAETHAVPVSKLVDELMILLPENSYLVNYLYDYHNVTIETHFETMTDTANYMELLTNSSYLLNAKVDFINTVDPEGVLVDEENELSIDYNIIPRYQATYSMDVNQQELMKEEENE